MNCQAHRDAILDLARGVDMPGGTFEALQAHLRDCAQCAADLRRQESLTAGLRELAGEAAAWSAPVTLEERLRSAIAAPSAALATAPSLDGRRRVPWWTLAAAAVVVLVSWLGVRALRTAPPAPHVLAPEQALAPRHAPSAAAAPSSAAADVSTPRAEPSPAVRSTAASQPAVVRRPRTRPRPAIAQSARSVEFMAIPGAAGLPALESATIVRTELPLAALPTYGVTISPDARRSAVEADLLVGQDGQARAIRLVTAQHDPETSRSGQ